MIFVNIGLGLIFLILLISERKSPYFVIPNKTKHTITNLSLLLINMIVSFLLMFLIKPHIQYFNFQFPSIVRGFILFLILDFWMYLTHLIYHKLKFLSLFHRVHHSDIYLDVSSGLRFHPIEVMISSIFRIVFFRILFFNFFVFILYQLLQQSSVFFHHSNINLPENIDKKIRKIIITPHLHRIHHSTIKTERDSNYGSLFSFWDRLFGTYKEKSTLQQLTIGLTQFRESKYQTIGGMLETPFIQNKSI